MYSRPKEFAICGASNNNASYCRPTAVPVLHVHRHTVYGNHAGLYGGSAAASANFRFAAHMVHSIPCMILALTSSRTSLCVELLNCSDHPCGLARCCRLKICWIGYFSVPVATWWNPNLPQNRSKRLCKRLMRILAGGMTWRWWGRLRPTSHCSGLSILGGHKYSARKVSARLAAWQCQIITA